MRLLAGYSKFQRFVHFSAWVPLVWMLLDWARGELTFNPIQAATQRTGLFAITFLVLSLACTPLNTYLRIREAIKVRRALGLYAFMYAAIHLSIFAILDYQLDFSLIGEILFEKPYAFVGFLSFLILLALAFTSFKTWMKKLGKQWKMLHRLVYLAGILVVIHFFWAVKGNLTSLSGDILAPLLYGLVVVILLLLRWKPVKNFLMGLRKARPAKRGEVLPAD